MKCELIRNLMSSYIDKELNEVERNQFEKHIAKCPDCQQEYELLLEIVTDCNNIEEVELPENFREELHQRLETTKPQKSASVYSFFRKNSYKFATGLTAAVLIFAIAIGGNSLGGSMNKLNLFAKDSSYSTQEISKGDAYNSRASSPMAAGAVGSGAPSDFTIQNNHIDAGVNYSMAAPAPAVEPMPQISGSMPTEKKLALTFGEDQSASMASRALTDSGRKVIKTGNIALKTTEFNAVISKVKQITEQNAGYVENSSIDNIAVQSAMDVKDKRAPQEITTQYANISIRVPIEKFDSIFESIKGMGRLVNENINSSDITMQYTDTATRIENLRIQEKRLQDIMTKANNVDETLKIENELNRIRTDIEMMTGDLNHWDNMIQLSTINVNLTEVKDGTLAAIDVPNIWQKAYNGLIGTLNEIVRGISWLFIFLVAMLPYVVVLGVIALIILLTVRKRRAQKK